VICRTISFGCLFLPVTQVTKFLTSLSLDLLFFVTILTSNFSSSFYITCLFQFELCYFLQRLFFGGIGLGLGLEGAGLGLGLGIGTAGLGLGLEGAGLGLGLETTGLGLGLGTLVLTTRLLFATNSKHLFTVVCNVQRRLVGMVQVVYAIHDLSHTHHSASVSCLTLTL